MALTPKALPLSRRIKNLSVCDCDAIPASRQEGVQFGLMEPVTTVTTAWNIAKTAGEISKKLFDLGKNIKDREIKQQLDEILDTVRELKQSASELEDENRELRGKLRFKSDEYEFRSPFYYPKNRPNQPFCAKCFTQGVEAPMGEPGQDCNESYRRCLSCGQMVQIASHRQASSPRLVPDHPF